MKGTLTFTAVVFAAAFGIGVWAQAPAPRLLPLDNLGLEHLDIVVPDTAASARFYARVFKTKLHQQPVRDFAIRVAPYDRAALAARQRELGTTVLASTDEPDVLRFRDNNGITVELKTVEPTKLTLKVHTGRGQIDC